MKIEETRCCVHKKKAFDMAKVNILKILKATHDTVDAIELMQNLPQDDFDAMNVKAEAILEKADFEATCSNT